MKERYKRRIRKFAEQSLEKKLERTINPYINHIPSEIRDAIRTQVADFFFTKECLGSELQNEGREVAEKLFDGILRQALPLVEKNINKRKIDLEKSKLLVEHSEDAIKNLKQKIGRGIIGKRCYWRGANVLITPHPIPEESLAWTHNNDIQVITESAVLAHSISWLFIKIRDIMSPFLDFRNKYGFYGELAEAANRIINGASEVSEKDILISILETAESFHREWLPIINDYFKKEEALLQESENWLFNHGLGRPSG